MQLQLVIPLRVCLKLMFEFRCSASNIIVVPAQACSCLGLNSCGSGCGNPEQRLLQGNTDESAPTGACPGGYGDQ